MDKPRTRFCWHCSRKLQGNHFAEYQSENGPVVVHKDCKKILEGGFNHVLAVDDGEYHEDFLKPNSIS